MKHLKIHTKSALFGAGLVVLVGVLSAQSISRLMDVRVIEVPTVHLAEATAKNVILSGPFLNNSVSYTLQEGEYLTHPNIMLAGIGDESYKVGTTPMQVDCRINFNGKNFTFPYWYIPVNTPFHRGGSVPSGYSYRLKPGDTVSIRRTPVSNPTIEAPSNFEFDIILKFE